MSGTRPSLASLFPPHSHFTSLLVGGGDGVAWLLVELEGRAPVLSVSDVQRVARRSPPGRIVIVAPGLLWALVSPGSGVRQVVVILTTTVTTSVTIMTIVTIVTIAIVATVTIVSTVSPACPPDP